MGIAARVGTWVDGGRGENAIGNNWMYACGVVYLCGMGGVFVRYGRGVNGRKGEYERMQKI